MSDGYFTPETFSFLTELAANNNREWFMANKVRYEEQVREPALDFITDFTPTLADISPHFVADPRKQGGSMFRINRDIRFAKDKSPYKTAVGIQFRHELAKTAYVPGFYLNIAPGDCFMGVGSWHPPGPDVKAIRAYLAEHRDEWRAAVHQPPFVTNLELVGDSLKRAPKGVDPDDPQIEDLKRKDFIGTKPLTQQAVSAGSFLADFGQECRNGAPLVKFLCRALDVPF